MPRKKEETRLDIFGYPMFPGWHPTKKELVPGKLDANAAALVGSKAGESQS